MNATIITFIIYSVIILAITYAAVRRTHSHEDYILGARSMNAPITAMGVAASDMSAWLMLSVPGLVYVFGLNQIWLPISLLVGSYLNWLLVAPRLRVFTEVAKNSLTIPAYLENRFAEHVPALRYIAAFIFLVFFTIYAASGFVGGAKLFVTAFNLDYMKALYIVSPVIIFYSAVGGYFAVNWVDLFQGTLMLTALIMLPIMAFGDFGGFEAVWATISSEFPTRIRLLYDVKTYALLSSLAWGLGYFGQPHILVRFMSAESSHAITWGRRICTTWMVFALSGAVAVGFVGIAYFAKGTLPSDEAVLPALAQRLLNPWLAGIVFAAIVSAIMSTVAAVLIVAGSAFINDFYRHAFRPKASQKELVYMGRLSVFIIALVALAIAMHPDNPSVFVLVSHAWGGLGAAFGPVILVSLFSRRMSKYSALLGMIFGGATAAIWIIAGNYHHGIFVLYELLPGFLMSFVGIAIGYKLGKPNTTAIVQYDEMKAKMRY